MPHDGPQHVTIPTANASPPGVLPGSPPDITVLVPTRDEAGNVGPLVERIAAAAGDRRIEVLFVDDSDDDTPTAIEAARRDDLDIQHLHRPAGTRTGGLGGAVLAGLRVARAEWVVVMDGDLQHPPELAVGLADVGRARDLDLVAASRYVGGGDANGLDGAARHTVSGSATAMAKMLFPGRLARLSDPMSGLFAIRRDAIDLDGLRPIGFKILMEIMVRNPRLRLAEVPFAMQARHTGTSKASLGEGVRFLRHLAMLRVAVLAGQVGRSISGSPRSWAWRAFLFGIVGLTGLLVNTGVLTLLANGLPGMHYLLAAAIATQASTTWLFLLTEWLVFRGDKPGSIGSRAVRFFLLNNVALLLRLPLLALLVEWLGLGVIVANVLTLVILFLVRFVVADSAIYGSGRVPAAPKDPMRVVVDVSVPPTATDRAPDDPGLVPGTRSNGVRPEGSQIVPAPRRATDRGRAARPAVGRHYLPYRYSIPGVATLGSEVRLRELEYFRAQHLGHDTDIQVWVGPTGGALPRRRATMMQGTEPPSVAYSEHFGRLGANFDVRFGDPIVVTVAPPLARSPHVVYTNILEALLRFVAVSKGAMLLHSACLEVDGVGVLISAETDTGKTGTVLRMVREGGARFLSDDMTVLYPDGRVGCFPKPLTISHHTLRAIGNDELSPGEWRRLKLQSRLHSKEGRQFAMVLSRMNIPIMGVNALTQFVVPPPKYTVDRLLPCTIAPETTATELFIISRGAFGAGALSRADAMRTLMANTEDAYQFPPFRQLAPSVVIGGEDHTELRRREREILSSALENLRCRWISTPDFSWADEIPRTLAAGAEAAYGQLNRA